MGSDRSYKQGEIIMVYGTYRCAVDDCPHAFVGVPGRRFPTPDCGAPGWILKNRPHEFRF
jgi:hypothetical protein